MNGSATALRTRFADGDIDSGLVRLYGKAALDRQRARYKNLIAEAEHLLPGSRRIVAGAPGRTELGGNHTDHNNGRVVAGAVDLDCIAVAAPAEKPVVTLYTDSSDAPIVIDLHTLAPIADEQGSSAALIRGMAAARNHAGKPAPGFSALVHSTCKPGTGLSTSAAFSVLIGGIFSVLTAPEALDPVQLARDGQFAENHYFGKPCGLMDQLSSSVGNTIGIDFKNPDEPVITPIDFQPERFGYRLAIIDTGGCHVNLTAEYAAIPIEIAGAAGVLGRDKARGISLESILEHIAEIRAEAGDRALLRLLHFILEDERAGRQLEALQKGDFTNFLALVKESGESSCTLLQNCNTALEVTEQGIMLARALSSQFFPDSVCRVHGGGFAGTVQAYIPAAQFDAFRTFMERVFGSGTVLPVRIGRPGFCFFTENGWQFPVIGGAA